MACTSYQSCLCCSGRWIICGSDNVGYRYGTTMKRRGQTFDPEYKSPSSSHGIIECSLKSFQKEYKVVQPIIKDFFARCNDIVIDSCLLVRLHWPKMYLAGQPIPEIDKHFSLYAIKATGTRYSQGRKAENTSFKKDFPFLTKLSSNHSLRATSLISRT